MRWILLAGFAILAPTAVAHAELEELIVRGDLDLPAEKEISARLVIQASHVTINGNGATLVGPGLPDDPGSFVGVGIEATGCSNVRLKNIRVRGFAIGLLARDGAGWHIQDCDFSHNYHNPEAGWGDGPRQGGLIMTNIDHSVIRGNTARHVWNGLDVRQSDDNLIAQNDFSHCSNVCLKLVTASRNRVLRNDLSYGLRIDREAGEVHARDSTCVLIESGSDNNWFEGNNITHGGDGIFIRPLNSWVSSGNVFLENDCSYANNNCIECWSPGNTFIRNKANHGSYGFWLGGSDQTTLIGNEAAYNGLPDGFHNAPEPDFGHGGIVCVNGPGSHFVVSANHVHHNAGGGIVFRGDRGSAGKRWKIRHWVIQQNRCTDNRWGIWGRWADDVYLGPNSFERNAEQNVLLDITNLRHGEDNPAVRRSPIIRADFPQRVMVGDTILFDASASADPGGRTLGFRWDLGMRTEPRSTMRHTFEEPGFYRVGLTVDNGVLADLKHCDLVVAERAQERLGTETGTSVWRFDFEGDADDRARLLFSLDDDAIVGRKSLRMDAVDYPGADVTARIEAKDAPWDWSRCERLVFWLKSRNPDTYGWQDAGPVVRCTMPQGHATFRPGPKDRPRNYARGDAFSESRWVWTRLFIPLPTGANTAWGEADDEGVRATTAQELPWVCETEGTLNWSRVEALSLTLDSYGAPAFTVWIDGLRAE